MKSGPDVTNVKETNLQDGADHRENRAQGYWRETACTLVSTQRFGATLSL